MSPRISNDAPFVDPGFQELFKTTSSDKDDGANICLQEGKASITKDPDTIDAMKNLEALRKEIKQTYGDAAEGYFGKGPKGGIRTLGDAKRYFDEVKGRLTLEDVTTLKDLASSHLPKGHYKALVAALKKSGLDPGSEGFTNTLAGRRVMDELRTKIKAGGGKALDLEAFKQAATKAAEGARRFIEAKADGYVEKYHERYTLPPDVSVKDLRNEFIRRLISRSETETAIIEADIGARSDAFRKETARSVGRDLADRIGEHLGNAPDPALDATPLTEAFLRLGRNRKTPAKLWQRMADDLLELVKDLEQGKDGKADAQRIVNAAGRWLDGRAEALADCLGDPDKIDSLRQGFEEAVENEKTVRKEETKPDDDVIDKTGTDALRPLIEGGLLDEDAAKRIFATATKDTDDECKEHVLGKLTEHFTGSGSGAVKLKQKTITKDGAEQYVQAKIKEYQAQWEKDILVRNVRKEALDRLDARVQSTLAALKEDDEQDLADCVARLVRKDLDDDEFMTKLVDDNFGTSKEQTKSADETLDMILDTLVIDKRNLINGWVKTAQESPKEPVALTRIEPKGLTAGSIAQDAVCGQGTNTCFIMSVVNALMVTDGGRERLKSIFSEEGLLLDGETVKMSKGTDKMSSFETTVSDHYKARHDRTFTAGGQGHAERVAAMFGLKSADGPSASVGLIGSERSEIWDRLAVMGKVGDALKDGKIPILHQGSTTGPQGSGHYMAVVGTYYDTLDIDDPSRNDFGLVVNDSLTGTQKHVNLANLSPDLGQSLTVRFYAPGLSPKDMTAMRTQIAASAPIAEHLGTLEEKDQDAAKTDLMDKIMRNLNEDVTFDKDGKAGPVTVTAGGLSIEIVASRDPTTKEIVDVTVTKA